MKENRRRRERKRKRVTVTMSKRKKKRRKRQRRRKNRDPLSSKEPANKCFGCVGYVVSVKTVHLCHCSTMAALQKNYLQK